MNKRICISSGDYNGIGPEVILKTLQLYSLEKVTPIILSTSKVIDYYIDHFSLNIEYNYASSIDSIVDHKINLLESYGDDLDSIEIEPGDFTTKSGKCSMLSVEKGIRLCKKREANALVTAPISKEAVNLAGYNIPGHTEFLAEHTDTDDFMMMLIHDQLRVGLATVHIPVAKIPQQLSKKSIVKYIRIIHQTLVRDFNISMPEIAVLGLNPHAGDGGVIGTEEQDFIIAAVQRASSENINVSGPHPADGFFGNRKYNEYDAVLAMYHDQGLIPFKTLSFGAGVNFTAGLPIIRTSPDHGTAFDIAGKNEANPSSFEEAFSLAIELAANREREAVN